MYNVLVGAAYVLGLFFFVIWGILQKVWVICALALGLLFFFYKYLKKQI